MFSIKGYVGEDDELARYIKEAFYYEFMIDEDGNIGVSNTDLQTSAIVKMADGVELKSDDSLYRAIKLSRYQLKEMQEDKTYSNIPYETADSSTDGYYLLLFAPEYGTCEGSAAIAAYEAAEANAKAFCKELLESGKADYAQPFIRNFLSKALYIDPGCLYIYLRVAKGVDVDKSVLYNGSHAFSITFDSVEDAQNFDPNNIADFAENVNVSRIKGNVMYLQFKEKIDGERINGKAIANVLCALQDLEEVKKIDRITGLRTLYAMRRLAEAMNVGTLTWEMLDVIDEFRDREELLDEIRDTEVELLENEKGSIDLIPKDYPLGDTNYNDKVDLQDVISIAKYVMGKNNLDEYQQILADYNEDGRVGLQDVIGVAKQILENNKK